MTDEHQGLFTKGHDFQFRIALGIRNQADIDHVTQDILIHLVGSAIFHVYVHRGIRFQESLQVRRQVVQPNAIDR